MKIPVPPPLAAMEEPPVPLPDTVADRAAGRRTRRAREVASREVDVPSARAGRLHVGVGGASSSLGVVVPSGDGAPGDTRAAELVVGYARRVSDTALAPWVGVELGAGRAWAVPHDADTRSVDPGPGLPTWSVDASGGVAWAVGPARVDLGLGVGTRGLPGGGWAPHRSDDDESVGTRPDARAPADAREPFDPAPSAPLALLGPRLNVSLGGDRGPRARLGLAPSVVLRPGHRPDAWVQFSLGGEFPT